MRVNAGKIAVVLALAVGVVIAWTLIRLVDKQETANCIAAAEARNPVEVLLDDDGVERLTNFGERQEAVDAC